MTAVDEVAGPLGQDAPAGQVAPVRRARPRPLPARVGLLLAAAAGGTMLVSFPPYGQWWLAPVAVALLAVAVHRRRVLAGAGLALLAGVVFFVPLLSWTTIVGGVAPWLILAVFEA